MTDRPKRNHWDLLASDLGAEGQNANEQTASRELPESAPPAPGPAQVQPQEPSRGPGMPNTEPRPRPKRSPEAWAELAHQLGIASSPEPSRPKEEKPIAQSETSAWPRLSAEPAESYTEPEPAAITKPAFTAEGHELEAVEPADTAAGHKRRKHRRRSRKPKGPQKAETAARDEQVVEEVATDAAVTEGVLEPEEGPETAEVTSASPPDSPGARAKRRRRRPRKKGAPEKDAPVDQTPPAHSRRDGAPRATKGRPAAEPSRKEEAHHHPGEEPSDELQDAEASAAGIGHRGIPNWQEAIDLIISANLEARAKKPGGDTAPRSRGGRGRSGRKGSGRKPT